MTNRSVTIQLTLPIKTLICAITAAHSRGESVHLFMENAVFTAGVSELGKSSFGNGDEIEGISYDALQMLVAFVRLEKE
jgi:hypothetical protein